MLVIIPHWWKWHKFSISELAEMGADGFEIYNCGYRNLSLDEQKEIIRVASKEKLIMAGSTDWHGWGYMTDVWTVFPVDSPETFYEELLKRPRTSVITYRIPQSSSPARFIFEPFFAFYYYIKDADVLSVLSFMVWTALIFVLITGSARKKIKSVLPFAMAIFFAATLVYFFMLSMTASSNKIIMSSVMPACAVLCALWGVCAYAVNKNPSAKKD